MLTLNLLLAALQPAPVDLKPRAASPGADGELRDILLIVGVSLVLGLSLFLYVYMTRRNRRTNATTGARALYRAEKKRPGAEIRHENKHRKRRRRKEEFEQRNPTLGETGGLPPMRTEEPAEPVS